MYSEDRLQNYFNVMADAMKAISDTGLSGSEIEAISGFNREFERMYEELCACYTLGGIDAYLEKVSGIVAEKRNDEKWIIDVFAICINMDSKVNYSITEYPEMISANCLIHDTGKDYTVVGALNTNCAETGVCINPRFGEAFQRTGEDHSRPLANREAFFELNGKLQNVCCFRYDKAIQVVNIVISDIEDIRKKGYVRISFAPMTNVNCLESTEQETIRDGKRFLGKAYRVKDEQKKILEERLQKDWKLASENGSDIFFGPEMLGTPELYRTDDFQRNAAVRKFVEEARSGNVVPPGITILPSFWENGNNGCMICGNRGNVLGIQNKRYPFINTKEHFIEALNECETHKVFIIHLANICRIAVMICSDFIYNNDGYLRELICGQLMTNLIIVPSYTKGEHDFLNTVSSLNEFGSTVFWGNCCAAAGTKRASRAIGACCVAGTGKTDLLKDHLNEECNGKCEGHESCVFAVDIPICSGMNRIADANTRHLLQ